MSWSCGGQGKNTTSFVSFNYIFIFVERVYKGGQELSSKHIVAKKKDNCYFFNSKEERKKMEFNCCCST